MRNKLKKFLHLFGQTSELERKYRRDLDDQKVLQGRLLANLNKINFNSITRLADVEFKVFSQWGDDGIIQWLISKLDIPNKTFIEFGVENYRESNTRFLLMNNNWQGLVIDGSEEHIRFIKNDILSYAHHLHAKHAFITKENINGLLSGLPFPSEVGILSIDIDGNDYWIWKEITTVNPVIVIVEYNAHFKLNPWTIPYKADFTREINNAGMNYWGASLASFVDLAGEKGYQFIGCNSAGNNAYFIRKDMMADINPVTVEEGYEFAKFRETKDEMGEWVSDSQRLATMAGMQVFNTRTNVMEYITIRRK